MVQALASEHVRQLGRHETFQFRCHPGVPCFNECCRQLELALTPYDVLRLKGALGLTSGVFLDRHAVIEQPENGNFPQIYLGMVDDGRGSCPFVARAGCRVYKDRPGACRMYPLARGAYRGPEGELQELYMLVTEPHCRGFSEPVEQFIDQWLGDQELLTYNAVNDQVMAILHHEKLKQGQQLGPEQREKFLLALYRLDEFKLMVLSPDFASPFALSDREREKIATNELALLRFGIRWLRHELFGEK